MAIVIALTVWGVSKCSTSSEDYGDEYRKARIEVVDAARRDVEKVLNTAPGSMQRDESLLRIRARENELRENGFGHDADDYINIVRKHLAEHGIQ